jgi:L-threonylcarbamoyladenylate synthase
MEPRLLKIRGPAPDPGILEAVAGHLRRGGLVAMPTETVYGFGGTTQPGPLKRLQRMKGRGVEKPFLILIPGVEAVPDLTWNPSALELANVFWPGALTLVLRDEKCRFPLGVRSPTGNVAVRQSPHPVARGLVEALGEPLISTSANKAGGLPALSAEEALETALALGSGEELWVLDAGPLDPSEPSTVIDCTGTGSIPVGRLRCLLPGLEAPA